MSSLVPFFIHGESTIFDANKSYFDFSNQDNYDLYCSEENSDPYSLNNINDNIITMQCGHYIHKHMLLMHIFPSFPLCCVSNECLNDNSQNCNTCQTNCVFVCDLCTNFVCEPNTIKNVISCGIEFIIKYNSSNTLNDRKRKLQDSNIDDNNDFLKMKKN